MTDAPLDDAATLDDIPRQPTQDGPAVRLYLVDGSGFIFRAYHALPPLTRKSDGLPIGAISGFCNMLWKLLVDMRAQAEGPTHLAVIFDHSEKTFRNKLYDQYKAHRPPAPEDLVPQFPLVREATRAFGVPSLELAGYEADDLIAAYACKVRDAGGEVTIVSSDKDLMQLVGPRVSMLDTMKNLKIGHDQVVEKFGVPPNKVVDVQALCGDSVDNVPGAPGIGIKTAALLINEYGDLDTLLSRASEIKQPKRRDTLIDFADQIRLSRELVRLDCETPLPAPIDDLVIAEPNPEVLGKFLEEMELRTLARRVSGGTASAGAPAAGASAPAAASAPEHPTIDTNAYVCVRDLPTLDAWIARARAVGVVAFDTETDALSSANAGLCGVSLAVAPGEACYIPVGHENEGTGGLEFETPAEIEQIPLEEVMARLKPLLEDPSVLKVAQNAKYDIAVLSRYGIEVAPIEDTMLISYVLEAGLHKSHGMDDLSKRWLAHEPIKFSAVTGTGKAQKSFKHVPLEPATCYAAEDADVTLRLYQHLRPRLAPEGLLTVYETLERGMPPVLAMMENHGIKVDPDQLRKLSYDFSNRMGELEAQAHKLAGRPFNLGSPKQVGELLFQEMGLASGRMTATGAASTDASMLEDLAVQGHELPRVLLDWRQLSKLKGTYTDNLVAAIAPRTNRIHTSYALASTTTGRLSSNDPNLQNIPIRTEEGRKIRKAFIAEPGHVLISADYSQIELRILAHVGDIPQLKKAFLEGHDIHAATASEMFGVPIEGMPAETRRRAKAINFGIVYGISAFGLANQLSIPQDEAGAYIKTYFERFPGIRAYMDRTKQMARTQGFVTTVFGRKVNIPAVKSKSAAERAFGDRAAINAPIQGAAADVMRRAMIRMPGALDQAGLKARMLLQVHDELVFEAPEAEAEAVIALAKRVMERAAEPTLVFSVPLVVEARAATNWDDAH
ncbi:MAG: DNA polymerase I [Pseudomonadota bacterium]|uniref:DNA polymerase I n=1 Tax=unclassified Phenylobacterium TaxID=2640670 RepID=UPI0006F69527|nr:MULTISPECIES: DNA polymerase I [unclassified Phenylobacterium]KRB41633.1 DNA polymerase I [Phenylobacterium sp. Root700]MBT9472556.1 DNA polymerase I [Phenylobacterium sp.]